MINLVKNALNFTKKDGFVNIIASYLKEKESIRIEVKDTGIGISEKDQSRLFRKFGRLEDVHNMNQKGIGLGLIIC